MRSRVRKLFEFPPESLVVDYRYVDALLLNSRLLGGPCDFSADLACPWHSAWIARSMRTDKLKLRHNSGIFGIRMRYIFSRSSTLDLDQVPSGTEKGVGDEERER